MFKQALYMSGVKRTVKTFFLGLFMPALNAQSAILDPYWIFAENFPKGGRIGKSFLVLLGCPSGRYYLGRAQPWHTAESRDQNFQLGWKCIQNGG